MERLQLCLGEGRPALQLATQSGVADQTAACHETSNRWELADQVPTVLGREQVPVVAQRQAAVCHGVGEGLPPGLSPVEVPAEAGMDDEFTDGIALEQIQQRGPLLQIFHPNPGFDGNIYVQGLENLVQETCQRLRLAEKAGALLFGHHCARGTA